MLEAFERIVSSHRRFHALSQADPPFWRGRSKAERMTSQHDAPRWGRRLLGRRRAATALAGLARAATLGGGLSGCAAQVRTHDVSIGESQLTLLLSRQLPLQRKVLEVIDLEAGNPQLHLLPDANRLGTELDVSAVDRLFGSRAQGHLSVDYGLRFEPGDHSIRMTQVRVRELTLASGSNALHGAAQRLGALVAEDMLENLTLYKMKPAQADEMDRLGLAASPIRVTAQGIEMTVSPR
jgi:hypothetical protein